MININNLLRLIAESKKNSPNALETLKWLRSKKLAKVNHQQIIDWLMKEPKNPARSNWE